MKSIKMCIGGLPDAEIEIAGHGEVGCELGILEVAHTWRAHAGSGELIVQSGCRPAAEISAGGMVNRGKNLK